jgi:hypothetical protein
MARWLTEQGAGRLVLLGRRAVAPETAATLRELEAAGTTIVAQSVDVAVRAQLTAVLETIRKDGPPLRGVLHSAGVLDDAVLLHQDVERFSRVFAPKIIGTDLLHQLTRADPLDWFVLFSSAASVLGSRGQSNHSAANAFLDLLARERAALGLPGLSINWGVWTEVGAAADRGLTSRLAAQGFGALTPSQGLLAWERLLAEVRPQVAVLPVDWQRYLAEIAVPSLGAYLADVAETRRALQREQAAPAEDASLVAQLAAAPRTRRRAILATFVGEKAVRALGLDPTAAIDPRAPLNALGLDSLLSIELRNTLSAAVGQPLPATLLFDYPTINALTDFLLTQLGQADDEAEAPEAASQHDAPAAVIESVEEISDEEVDCRLAARAAGGRR